MDPRTKNLVGHAFGRLQVTAYYPSAKKGPHWVCKCWCGNQKVVSTRNLRSASVQSCGCLHAEKVTKHHDSNSTEYRAWDSMKRRCYKPATKGYEYYGGRGVRVCDQWIKSYSQFLADVGRKPTRRHTLDRIDSSGDYEPGNVRWATMTTQIRNRRNAVKLEYAGKTYSTAELAALHGIPFGTFRSRINRGWPVERAVKP